MSNPRTPSARKYTKKHTRQHTRKHTIFCMFFSGGDEGGASGASFPTSFCWTSHGSHPDKQEIVDVAGEQVVRCCAADGNSCVTKNLGGLENTQFGNGCSGELTWKQAGEFCENYSLRLCTRDELPRCRGTGCGYNLEMVWTSDCVGKK